MHIICNLREANSEATNIYGVSTAVSKTPLFYFSCMMMNSTKCFKKLFAIFIAFSPPCIYIISLQCTKQWSEFSLYIFASFFPNSYHIISFQFSNKSQGNSFNIKFFPDFLPFIYRNQALFLVFCV